MAMVLSRMFARRGGKVEAEAEVKVAEPVVAKVASKHARVGLWVLSAFATVAALVTLSAMAIGRDNADVNLLIPLVLFWSITVCIGFAIRSALINVVKSARRPKVEQSDAAIERLARMAQRERNYAATHPHPARVLLHAA